MIVSARAQSPQQNPLERARTAVETLINRLRGRDMPEGIVKTNGRIEATQVDVAAKYSGRLATVTKDEGDEVTAGQVVATISSPETEAQLRGAQAQVLKAKKALAETIALIAQRKSDLDFTRTDYERGKPLIEHGTITQQTHGPAPEQIRGGGGRICCSERPARRGEAAIRPAEADVERLQSILVDLVLVSPRSGRVQYRLARAGEVVSAGQRVLTILDLKDVYMTVYLSADVAGQLTLGDEARIILDPLPQYVFPASISFVATDAQFTPKSVETAEERQKLMFRVKLQGDPVVLDKYLRPETSRMPTIGTGCDAAPGASAPLDATVLPGGVNFSVFSKHAVLLELLLFDDENAMQPARIIPLHADRHRTYHYWHAFVPGLQPGQVYAYRAHGIFDPGCGLRFDAEKVLGR